jgi:LAO/AO transport system kinase
VKAPAEGAGGSGVPSEAGSGEPSATAGVAALAAAVRAGDRAQIGRALTLVESRNPEHRERARELLDLLAPHTGRAFRVGISGVPGAGKSTLVETLGSWLLDHGHRVAVLAVDPSSRVTGGSILGDKTRMTRLSQDPRAFVRPSPSGGSLGGVARRTREAMLVLEAAGHDVVLVETVGVGQSETAVAAMVDTFVVLLVAGAGDELQGIKRGILELADLVAINKADGSGRPAAEAARRDFTAALRLLHGAGERPRPPVLLVSGLTGQGLPELWGAVATQRERLTAEGRSARRREQLSAWLGDEVEEALREALRDDPAVKALWPEVEARVLAGEESPAEAAARLLAAFRT